MAEEKDRPQKKDGRQRKKRPKRDVNYYASRAMSRAERVELSKAAQVSGLADEIALLRLKLKKAMERADDDRAAKRDVRALTEALHVMLKAVSVQHKVGPVPDMETLADRVSEMLERVWGVDGSEKSEG